MRVKKIKYLYLWLAFFSANQLFCTHNWNNNLFDTNESCSEKFSNILGRTIIQKSAKAMAEELVVRDRFPFLYLAAHVLDIDDEDEAIIETGISCKKSNLLNIVSYLTLMGYSFDDNPNSKILPLFMLHYYLYPSDNKFHSLPLSPATVARLNGNGKFIKFLYDLRQKTFYPGITDEYPLLPECFSLAFTSDDLCIDIPSDIRFFTRIESLTIANPLIMELPEALLACTGLKELFVRGSGVNIKSILNRDLVEKLRNQNPDLKIIG